MTNAERLATIETLLKVHAEKTETILATNAETAKAVHDQLVELDKKWEARHTKLEAIVQNDVAKLTGYENKGKGVVLVIGPLLLIIGALFTPIISAVWEKITASFH